MQWNYWSCIRLVLVCTATTPNAQHPLGNAIVPDILYPSLLNTRSLTLDAAWLILGAI